MRAFLTMAFVSACLGMCGCEGDYAGQPGDPGVEVKGTPDLDPRTDHDVDVKPLDVDVDVNKRPGQAPDVDVDVLKTPDKDTDADEKPSPTRN